MGLGFFFGVHFVGLVTYKHQVVPSPPHLCSAPCAPAEPNWELSEDLRVGKADVNLVLVPDPKLKGLLLLSSVFIMPSRYTQAPCLSSLTVTSVRGVSWKYTCCLTFGFATDVAWKVVVVATILMRRKHSLAPIRPESSVVSQRSPYGYHMAGNSLSDSLGYFWISRGLKNFPP